MDDLKTVFLKWYEIPNREIDNALRKLLCTFSQFDRKHVGGSCTIDSMLVGRGDACTANSTFVLPTITFEAAKELCNAIKEACMKLRDEEREYQKRLESEMAEQKNEIYNAGVKHGRNLLFQLNNGEISMDDFTKRIKKF